MGIEFIEIFEDHIRVREATKQGYAIAMGGDSINLEHPNSKTRRGRVGKGIAQTLTTSCNQGVVVEVNKIISVGQISNKGSQAGKVYSTEGLFPTVCACTHGYAIGNVLEENMNDYQVLRKVRTDYGKEIRKEYESGNIDEKIGNMTRYEPRTDGVSNTLTTVLKDNYIIEYDNSERCEDMNDIIVEGNYSPSNYNASRIVSDDGIAPTVMEKHGTVTGVKQKINKNEGGNNMWSNNLEKFNFDMKKVRVLSLFSGIGAFEESLKYLGVNNEIVNFAEIDIDAIIDYGAIHILDFENRELEYPEENVMKQFLIDKNIGYDFVKGKSKIPKLKKDKLYKLYKVCILGNNLGDVSLIDWDKSNIDLIVGGSPCQDFSIAGKLNGSIWKCNNAECNHEYNPIEQHWSKRDCCPKCGGINLNKTRSSLLVEYLRAIRENKPKYFIYENVKNIKGKGFIDIFNLFEAELKEYGYNSYNDILNGKNFGIPQNRERVFVVGIREDIESTYKFPNTFDNGVRLKDILENEIDEKYYIDTDRAKMLVNKLDEGNYLNSKSVPCDSTIMKPKGTDIANCITARYDAGIQNKQSIGVAVAERIGGLFDDDKKHQAGSVWNANNISPTIDTMQDGYREPCVVESVKNNIDNYRIRKLTPLECWRLMGFKDESFYKAKSMGASNSQLYKQAGNSIICNVTYHIFKELFKEYIID